MSSPPLPSTNLLTSSTPHTNTNNDDEHDTTDGRTIVEIDDTDSAQSSGIRDDDEEGDGDTFMGDGERERQGGRERGGEGGREEEEDVIESALEGGDETPKRSAATRVQGGEMDGRGLGREGEEDVEMKDAGTGEEGESSAPSGRPAEGRRRSSGAGAKVSLVYLSSSSLSLISDNVCDKLMALYERPLLTRVDSVEIACETELATSFSSIGIIDSYEYRQQRPSTVLCLPAW
jgi:hypothetical protein